MTNHPPPPDRHPAEPPERLLAAGVLALICVITLANVLVRYFTDWSFAATEEISVALLVILAMLGSASAFLHNRHIRITILRDRLPKPWRRAADAVAGLATIVVIGGLVWFGGRMAWDEYRFEVTTPSLGWPQWLYTLWLPLLAAVILLRLVQRLAKRGGQ